MNRIFKLNTLITKVKSRDIKNYNKLFIKNNKIYLIKTMDKSKWLLKSNKTQFTKFNNNFLTNNNFFVNAYVLNSFRQFHNKPCNPECINPESCKRSCEIYDDQMESTDTSTNKMIESNEEIHESNIVNKLNIINETNETKINDNKYDPLKSAIIVSIFIVSLIAFQALINLIKHYLYIIANYSGQFIFGFSSAIMALILAVLAITYPAIFVFLFCFILCLIIQKQRKNKESNKN